VNHGGHLKQAKCQQSPDTGWLRVEHWVYWRPQLVVAEWSLIPG